MFRISVIISICCLLLTAGEVFSQKWVRALEEGPENFYEIQREFNAYWDGREIEKGKGWKQFKRWEDFMEPRVYPDGNFPAADQAAKAFQNYLTKKKYDSSTGDMADWQPLGPVAVEPIANNPGIGRLNCSAMHPENPDILYVGAPSGGFWRSFDGGQNWETTTDHLGVIGVSSIVIDPKNPNTIYIATGDGDFGHTYSIGVLKSTDGGDTWQQTGLNWDTIQFRRISKLVIYPQNPQILFAATDVGILRTVDGGAVWRSVLPDNIRDIEFNSADPSIMYAGGRRFFISNDSGNSFSAVSASLPDSSLVMRYAIGVTPANPQYVYLLAGRASNNGFLGIYRSTDGGLSFSLQADSPNLLGWTEDGSDAGGQSWYDLAIAVSPTNANFIFTGGVNIWLSTDGGVNWEINTHYLWDSPLEYSHADIHALDFYGDVLFAATDGGLYKTEDDGYIWQDLSPGLEITQFYRLGGYAGDENLIFAGTQDNGTNRLRNGSWSHVMIGDGMESIIDYSNPDIVYACWQRGGINKSTDGGDNFTFIAGDITETGSWVTPYLMHPTDPQTLIAGFKSIWKTTNGGENWRALYRFEQPQRAMAMSTSHPDYLYASTLHYFHRSTDGGMRWQSIANGLPDLAMNYITVSPQNPEKVWITYSGYSEGKKVYRSTNAGETWENISGSLPNLPVNCILFGDAPYDPLYVGTDIGIYYRNDLSGDWEPYFDGLPNVIVSELEIHAASGKIRAATFGRGVWESPIYPDVTVLEHDPLPDTEETNRPYEVLISVVPGDRPLETDSLLLHYGIVTANEPDTNQFERTLPFVPGGDPHFFSAEIPAQAAGTSLKYFVTGKEMGGFSLRSPLTAPETYYQFTIGADTLAPEIRHTPLQSPAAMADWPLQLIATVTDNLGIDSVLVEYSLNSEAREPFALSGAGNEYQGNFPQPLDIHIDDVMEYRIVASDRSLNQNQTVDGPHAIVMKNIQRYSSVVDQYIFPDRALQDTMTIVVPDGNVIEDLQIVFKAIHDKFGDLTLSLRAPSGAEVTLVDRPGFPELPGGATGINPNILLNDLAAESVEEISFPDKVQAAGVFKPSPDSLSSFAGKPVSGDWILSVHDTVFSDLGKFQEWEMIVASRPAVTEIETQTTSLPQQFLLHQNFPNPFNPETRIRYDLKETANVKLRIYNILGEEVRTLMKEKQDPGFKSILWDGRDHSGAAVASGIYIYRLEANAFSQSRKMVLLR